MPLISVNIETNARDYADWLARVPTKIQLDVKEKLPKVKRDTKKEVKSHLTKSFGVDEGVYKKSFIINDFAQSKWQVGFQVYAKKPHYRLTHLLEGADPPVYGHRTILFRWGKGKPTKVKGVVGMSQVFQTQNHNHIPGFTRYVRHIEPGQQYAEKQFPILYDEGINRTLKERMKRIK